jgi:hypothetical protein
MLSGVIHVETCIYTSLLLLLNDTPGCGYDIFCFSIYQLMDIWITPIFAYYSMLYEFCVILKNPKKIPKNCFQLFGVSI